MYSVDAMHIPFFKMEGCGNDYLFIDVDRLDEGIRKDLNEHAPNFAREMSDRHFGIGSDGLVLILDTVGADARMRMFNADGSVGEVCGNALRCVAYYLAHEKLPGNDELTIKSGESIMTARVIREDKELVRIDVDMGKPIFEGEKIPFLPQLIPDEFLSIGGGGHMPFKLAFEIDERPVVGHILSMGNPHMVLMLDRDPEDLDIEEHALRLQAMEMFPNGVNIEFVGKRSDGSYGQRTYERGSGETLACGSGACAVAVVLISEGLAQRNEIVALELRGGTLELTQATDGDVLMSGPARKVFEGVYGSTINR